MTLSSYLTHVNCLECGHTMPYRTDLDVCSACNSSWLDAQYDYDEVAKVWCDGAQKRDQSLWRYDALLPPVPDAFKISMGEGGTPLIRARKLETA